MQPRQEPIRPRATRWAPIAIVSLAFGLTACVELTMPTSPSRETSYVGTDCTPNTESARPAGERPTAAGMPEEGEVAACVRRRRGGGSAGHRRVMR